MGDYAVSGLTLYSKILEIMQKNFSAGIYPHIEARYCLRLEPAEMYTLVYIAVAVSHSAAALQCV